MQSLCKNTLKVRGIVGLPRMIVGLLKMLQQNLKKHVDEILLEKQLLPPCVRKQGLNLLPPAVAPAQILQAQIMVQGPSRQLITCLPT